MQKIKLNDQKTLSKIFYQEIFLSLRLFFSGFYQKFLVRYINNHIANIEVRDLILVCNSEKRGIK